MRDVIDDGETEFHAMKDDLYDGVCDVCNEEYDDGLARMLATLNQAAILPFRFRHHPFSNHRQSRGEERHMPHAGQ